MPLSAEAKAIGDALIGAIKSHVEHAIREDRRKIREEMAAHIEVLERRIAALERQVRS